jgi:aryl-alcohol dehydrogenase-like predicted oxidoreductase
VRYVDADGLRVSVIGLGAWQFGSREWGYGEAYARETAPALVRRAVELGVTLIDTAEAYAMGRSERIVGDALAAMDGAAGRVTVATKFLPLAPAEPVVARQAAGSRARLGTDAIDLYYAHWVNPFVSPRRPMQAVRPLVESGVVHRVGVSNHSLDQWREAERALRVPAVANQVRFNLADPAPARDLVPYAAEAGRLVVAYSPLGQGLLAGADGTRGGPKGIRRMNRHFRDGARGRVAPLLAAVREIAAAHGATSAQVALAWLIAHPNTVAIPGARTVEQLEENAAAADLALTDEEHARLTAESEAYDAS